jgi:hypothetical protein
MFALAGKSARTTISVASGFALFGGGFSTAVTAVTDKYTYSGDTVAAGTALGTARSALAASSSSPGGF